MRTRVWCMSLVLASLGAACGDQPTEVVPEREPAQAPGVLAAATSTSEDGLSITTDKDDYAPGDTVRLTGGGWPAGDVLEIQLDDEPATHPPHTWSIQVGMDGAFRDSTYVVDIGDLGVTFTLTATSHASGRSLTVVFTDGNPQTFTIAVVQAPNPVTAGNAASYTIQVNYGGTNALCTVDLTAAPTTSPAWPSPPPGGFFAFSPSSVAGRGSGGGTAVHPQSTLTVTTPAGMPANTYQFKVSATRNQQPGETCQGAGAQVSDPIALVVGAPANDPPVLDPVGDRTVAEETQLAFTATASDDHPGLTFTIVNPGSGNFPTGAQMTAAGAFTWTPTEEQGPGTYRVKVVVTDAGSLTDEEEIQIIVTEANLPPVLAAIGPKTVDEETPLSFTATATDSDVPANTLTFSLHPGTDPVPAGAAIVGSTGAFSWTPTEAQGPGVYQFKVRVADNGVNPANLLDEEEITVTVSEVNKPPVLTSIGAKSVNEGSLLSFSATATDPDLPENALAFSVQTAGNSDLATAAINATTGAFTWTPVDDNPTGTMSDNYAVRIVVTDDGDNPPGLSDDEQVTITVNNVPPTITGITLDPNTAGSVYPITGQPKVLAAWTDPGATDTHTCTYSVQDAVSSLVVASGISCGTGMNVTESGLYTVTVTVTDDDSGSDVETAGALIVIYDPSAGFVTGGGWINSPEGACRYAACQHSTVGKATFGFVSKYVTQGKDKTAVLTGNTEFQFHAGELNFKSSSYEWLVVNGGSGRAQYKGVGTVNGSGGYGFILTAYDGTSDKFRIKIWETASGAIVYDNQMAEPDTSTLATVLGGGSIIIHVKK